MRVHTQGLYAEIVDRLPEWHFTVRSVCVVLREELPPYAQPTTLARVLTQLFHLHAPDTVVSFRQWMWTDALVQLMAAALPALPHMRVSLDLDRPLTDALLGMVLTMGTQLSALCVSRLELQTDAHADAAWPWDELTVCEPVLASGLVRLPIPAAGRTRPGTGAVIRFTDLVIHDGILEVSVMLHTWALRH